MKKLLAICALAIAFFVLAPGSGFAGKGKGPGDGGGVLTNGCPCEPFDISGEVLHNQKGGLAVLTDEAEEYSVWGLGPTSYWGDVAKPAGGDDVTITIVNFGDEEEPRYVAISITFNDDQTTVVLRDAVTCYPLWR